MSEDLQRPLAVLRRSKLRLTGHRKTLLEVLTAETVPLSIQEIHEKAGLSGSGASGLDLATVYRNLQKFEAAEIVRRCDFGDGIGRYELSIAGRKHHHHIRCRVCQKIEPIEYCGVENVEAAIQQIHGYEQVSHALEFFGVCPACLTRQRARSEVS